MFDLPPETKWIRDRIHQAIHGRSADPAHPDNASDGDWQSGFLFGSQYEPDPANELAHLDEIEKEWKRRGKPAFEDKQFESWKSGFWAGRFHHIAKTIKP